MEIPQNPHLPWIFAAFLVGLPLCFYFGFKGFTAKTRKAYLGYIAAAATAMFAMFMVLSASDFFPSPTQIDRQKIEALSAEKALSKTPVPVVVVATIFGLLWIGGGNWIMIRRRRQAGRSWRESLNPFNPPFRDMDGKTWMQLALLAVLCFSVLSVGLNMAQRSVEPAPAALTTE